MERPNELFDADQRRQTALAVLEEILRRVDRLAVVDWRSPDQIVGYDDVGLPS